MKKHTPLIAAFLIFPTIYIFPFLLTLYKIPFSPLPPDFSSDIYMYLNNTLLHIDADGLAQNPWYHVPVPTDQLKYLKFGLLNLFSLLNNIVGNLTATLILWNWIWAAITFVCAYLLFKEISIKKNIYLIIFGISLLFFFQVSDIPNYIKGFLSLNFSPHILLPLQRTFFPQIATPLLLLYLYFLIKAFESDKNIYWVVLFIVQFISFVNFPYNTVVMGATTFFVILSAIFSKKAIPWKHLIIYFTATCLADLAFISSGGSIEGTGHNSVVDIDFSRISEIMGGTNIVLLTLCTAAIALPNDRKFVKFTIASVGISVLLLQLSDLIFNPSLQLTHHFAYFVNQIIAVLVFYITAVSVKFISDHEKTYNALLTAGTVLLVGIGIFVTYAQATAALTHNRENYIIYTDIERLQAGENDLIIAPSITVNDAATWLPMIFKSEVLFSRNSEFLLPNTEAGRNIYWKREAIYLYLQGIDAKKLHEILLSNKSKPALIKRIILVGQRFDLHTDKRDEMLKQVYNKLSEYLRGFEEDPQILKRFFSKYRKIIVIDRCDKPLFIRNIPAQKRDSRVIEGISIRVYETG